MIRRAYELLVFFLRGGVAYAKVIGVKIGNDCRVFTRHFGSEPFLVTIGNRVTVTSGVKFLTHDGSLWLFRDEKGRRHHYQPIVIGNDVFIGVNSVLMPGVKIDNNVIIAAGSVVTKSVPSGVIVAGVPATIIGSYEESFKKGLASFLSDKDLDRSISFKERVLKATNYHFKQYLQKP